MTLSSAGLLLVGCGESDPCKGEPGVCLTARIDGTMRGLDQLSIAVDRPEPKEVATPTPPRAFQLPVKVAIVLPQGTTGVVRVAVTGMGGGVALGYDEEAIDLGRLRQVTFTLEPPEDDVGTPDAGVCQGVTECLGGDGCCPPGCDWQTDADCPQPICGNHLIEPGEACDDGNLDNGDECDPTCRYNLLFELLSGSPAAQAHADALGSDARFFSMNDLTTDGNTLWVTSPNGGVIRAIAPDTGMTSTFIGKLGERWIADGNVVQARFAGPTAIAHGGGSWMWVGDVDPATGTGHVRRVDMTSANHDVVTSNTSISNLRSLAASATAFAILDGSGLRLFTIDDDGGLHSNTSITQFFASPYKLPNPLACTRVLYAGVEGGADVYYVACPDQSIVFRATVSGGTGNLSLVAGTCTLGPNGCTYAAGCSAHVDATLARITRPDGLTLDEAGNLLISDPGCHRIWRLADGSLTAYAGSGEAGWAEATGGDLLTASFSSLGALTHIGGAVFAAEHLQVRLLANGQTRVLAGSHHRPLNLDAPAEEVGYQSVTCMASDGISLLAHTGMPNNILFAVSLGSGASATLYQWQLEGTHGPVAANDAVRIGDKLYVAMSDGTIQQIGTDGSNPMHFFGQADVTQPMRALTTDGTELYYVNQANLVGRLTLDGIVHPIAGSPDTTDVVDGVGEAAHFSRPTGLALVNANLYLLDGPAVPPDGAIGTNPGLTVVRRIEAHSGKVTIIAGELGQTGAQDGVGTDARLAGANCLASDGLSLFICDAGPLLPTNSNDGPTIRQMVLETGALTTMIGKRGAWSFGPGQGLHALVDLGTSSSLVYDQGTKNLYLFDSAETAFARIH